MSRNTVIVLVIGILLIGAAVIYRQSYRSSNLSSGPFPSTDDSSLNSRNQAGSPTPIKQKLEDSGLAQYAFQIYPGTLSADAKKATSGFKIDIKKNADGSAQVNLTPTNPAYHAQQYTVKSGQKLYFIEKFINDDNETKDTDQTPQDDSAIIVGDDGYIVQ